MNSGELLHRPEKTDMQYFDLSLNSPSPLISDLDQSTLIGFWGFLIKHLALEIILIVERLQNIKYTKVLLIFS